MREPRPYWNPYLAGAGLGLVLLVTFVLTGHGIGVSGAVASVVSAGVGAVAPAYAAANDYFRAYIADPAVDPIKSW